MALGGSYIDHNVQLFSDTLEQELQQRGSKLRGIVTIEREMGEKSHFDKLGVANSYERTTRYAPRIIQDQSYERRSVTPKSIESTYVLDELDLIRYLKSPQSDVMSAMVAKLGRDLDDIIIDAIKGNAVVTNNGSSSNVALPSGQKIQVNANTYTSLTGDTALHEGKLLLAKRMLQGAEVDIDREPLVCIASAKQLANVQSRSIQNSGLMYKPNVQIDIPGLDKGLMGFLGMYYIATERLGIDSSNDELAFVLPASAIKLGIWSDLSIAVDRRPDLQQSPMQLSANIAAGAVRMFEEKVVQIACDPT